MCFHDAYCCLLYLELRASSVINILYDTGHWKEGLPLWLQNAVSAPQQPSADSKAANVRRALDAAAAARQAGSQGAECFSHHWKPEGKLQVWLRIYFAPIVFYLIG
jgi:hypothetical protein